MLNNQSMLCNYTWNCLVIQEITIIAIVFPTGSDLYKRNENFFYPSFDWLQGAVVVVGD